MEGGKLWANKCCLLYTSVDEMIGEINVDSLEFTAPDKAYFMQNMNIRATKQNGENHVGVLY